MRYQSLLYRVCMVMSVVGRVYAQDPTPAVIDHWEVGVFRSLVSLTTPFSVTTYPRTLVSCGRLKREEVPENSPNPTTFHWDDPDDPTKDCEIDVRTLVIALPIGTGYVAKARACTVENVCSEWGDASQLFRRAPRGIPCLNGAGVEMTVDTDINGKPVRLTVCLQGVV